MKKSYVRGTWQRNRAFSPAVVTEGGKIVWIAGHTGSKNDDGNSLAGDFDSTNAANVQEHRYDPERSWRHVERYSQHDGFFERCTLHHSHDRNPERNLWERFPGQRRDNGDGICRPCNAY